MKYKVTTIDFDGNASERIIEADIAILDGSYYEFYRGEDMVLSLLHPDIVEVENESTDETA